MAMYSQFEKDRDQGNFELLPELHAILSGMKVPSSCLLLHWPSAVVKRLILCHEHAWSEPLALLHKQ